MSKYSTDQKIRSTTLSNLAHRVAAEKPVYIEVFQNINNKMQYRWMKVRGYSVENRRVTLILSDTQRVVGNADSLRRFATTPPVR